MNFFPCVHGDGVPIISGTIVERRDHVLITFFSFPRVQSFDLDAQVAVYKRPFSQ